MSLDPERIQSIAVLSPTQIKEIVGRLTDLETLVEDLTEKLEIKLSLDEYSRLRQKIIKVERNLEKVINENDLRGW